MGGTLEEILRDGGRFRVLAGNHDQVHVQLTLRHVLHSSAQGGDVVLEAGKAFRDSFVHFHKLFQLDSQGLGSGSAIAFFAGGGDDIIHDLVQALAFQVHRLNDFRINLSKFVIPEPVRICAGEDKQLAVDLVQPENTVLHPFQHRSHLSQRDFHADGVHAFGQVEAERITVLIAQGAHFPAGVICKGYSLQVAEGNLSVNVNGTAGQRTSLVHLARFNGDIVVAVLRHLKIPLDPFAGMRPWIAADIVQNRIGHGIRNRFGARAVIARIQAGCAAQRGGFTLDRLGIILPFVGHRDFRQGGSIFLIVWESYNGRQRDSADHHRLVHSLQGQGVLPFLKPESIGLRLVAHVVPEPDSLLVKYFFLAGADVISLVVLPDFASVRPQAAECQGARSGEGQLSVDQQLPFDIHSSAFGRQILQPDIIQAGLRHLCLPGYL